VFIQSVVDTSDCLPIVTIQRLNADHHTVIALSTFAAEAADGDNRETAVLNSSLALSVTRWSYVSSRSSCQVATCPRQVPLMWRTALTRDPDASLNP